ncbi:hypothetical protein BKA82DRAFT_32436 [Pisolithus tinctorius]|uniref:Uncharacterized protein n=1 Tax=Pisolithus tinctorius Marx 270 TaxID=870435 RepID=A0A0C3JIC7_PISTI|nr:hypothetical protein BKA82DRAFT_32436 [Pisolithus tinctorius]KIN97326.1 hypothetical protein M404DRAFT_32436 [Pisolithus tinctorius Marx 270]
MADVQPNTFQTTFIVNLDTYETSVATTSGKGKKGKVKVTKAVKIKEIMFMITHEPSNYLELLVEMLAKHGRTGYKISEKKRYSFNCTDAMDVDNAEEFAEMAKKIIETTPDKCSPQVQEKSKDIDDDSDGSNTGDEDSDTLKESSNDFDENIALFCCQITKEWGNTNDNSVTYLHPTGVSIPCTPLMIRDWAIAISFDPANKVPALHPGRCFQTSITPVTPSPNADIAALTSVLLLDMAREHLRHSTPAPALQVVDSAETNLDPNIIPSPSKLTHFLEHAEANLGVQHARLLEPALWQLGAGPDILLEMDDAILHDAGVTPGDIICLK